MDPAGYGVWSDLELLRQARSDPGAFGEFYDRHVQALIAYCARRTGCAQTAADLTSEVFATAYARRSTFRDMGAPAEAWLYGIARRQLSSFHRRQRVSDRYRRRFGFESTPVSPDETERIEALIMAQPLKDALREAVADLPAGQAAALRLRIGDELSYRDVARELGCSEGAARVHVSRALMTLAALMEAR